MVRPDWLSKLKFYTGGEKWKSINQLANTVIPYLTLFIVMMIMLKIGMPYWFILIFAPVTSGFLVRTFILFHDCTHNSFFKSERSNVIVGHLLGIITFTSYYDWQKSHQIHHNCVGNLDKRGIGDINVLTVDEYIGASRLTKFLYWWYRSPFLLLVIAPLVNFLVIQRFPNKKAGRKEVMSIILTDIMIALLVVTASLTIGFLNFLFVFLPVFYVAGTAGIWLFYVQHQFHNVYWEHGDKWNMYDAAMKGSSYYKMPRLFQWFTGNIGFHNLHHLNPRIPNYKLMKCYKDMPEMKNTIIITMVRGFGNLLLNVYDEKSRRLISFHRMKKLLKERNKAGSK
jgi:acyl-lipid omega-6 desaturase (Delta-12 desaturase)